ncbi:MULTISPECIES: hypothetical protein [unclassified Pseudovibrio]|uniref:hypothetical protein n=1 Tax=unclassified Pseudovibrio TaxID=2627060 RepID=UPI0007AEAF07|nr:MULTISPECIES: hypothetical protein [unclassified Pseudovibrio]KZL02299.1 hypothetical protein PsW74_01397 [Pseudovibrio sp. W74]KZL08157.1 hypothetical protein PsAD14_03304 [Pseudovibrio sp. Ad14]
MKNKLMDLNNHLFMQLERLSDEDLDANTLEQEAKRTDAIVSVADKIVQNADLQFRSAKLVAEHGHARRFLPLMEVGDQPQVENNNRPLIEGKSQ